MATTVPRFGASCAARLNEQGECGENSDTQEYGYSESSESGCVRLGSGFLFLRLIFCCLLGLPAGQVAGVPAIYLYLFGVWACLIALAAIVAEGKGK